MGTDHGLLTGLAIFYAVASLTLFAGLACEFCGARRRRQQRSLRIADSGAKAGKLTVLLLAWMLFTVAGALHLVVFLNEPLRDEGRQRRIENVRNVMFTLALWLAKIGWIPAGALTRRDEIVVAKVLKWTARSSVGVIAAVGIAAVVIVGVLHDELREFGDSGRKTAKAIAPATVVMALDVGTWILTSIISLLYALHFHLSLLDKLSIFLTSLLTSTIVGVSITTYTLFLTRHPVPSFLALLLTVELSLSLLAPSLATLYLYLHPRNSVPQATVPDTSPTDLCFSGGGGDASIISSSRAPHIDPLPVAFPAVQMQAFLDPSIAAFPEPEDVLSIPPPPLRPRSTVDPVESEHPIDWGLIQLHLGVLPDVLPEVLSSLGSQATRSVSERSGSTESTSVLRRDEAQGNEGVEAEARVSRLSWPGRRGRTESESRSRNGRESRRMSQSGSRSGRTSQSGSGNEKRNVVVIQETVP